MDRLASVAVHRIRGRAAALVPLAASLFGLSEFADDWRWRLPAQVMLLSITFVSRVESIPEVPRLTTLAIAAILLIAACRAWSSAWLLIGLGAVLITSTWFFRRRAGAILVFATVASATIGVVCAYLHGPVIWEWPRLHALVRHFLGFCGRVCPSTPSLLPSGEVVLGGNSIHLSAFSVLSALLVIAAVIGCGPGPAWRSFSIGAFALLFAVVLKVSVIVGSAILQRPAWIAHPLFQGCYLLLVGLVTLCLVPLGGSGSPTLMLRWTLGGALVGMALWLTLAPRTAPPPSHLHLVVDDAHGRWEETDKPYDARHYGRDTVYTYSLLRDWLSRRHDLDVQTTSPIRPHGDVLIIKTPALPYSEQEKATIGAFVAAGGALLVIGDHTNLFGTTAHINALLAPAGLRLREDAAIPFQGVTRSFSPRWFNAGSLVPQGTAFDFATSATIAATSLRAQPLLVDLGVIAEKAQYSNERNFGDLRPTLDDRFPPLVVAATAPWGKGRVVLFADSTPWSNFSFFAPGSKETLDAALRVTARPPNHLRLWLSLAIGLVGAIVVIKSRAGPLVCVSATFAAYGLMAALFPVGAAPPRTTPLRRGASSERLLLVDAAHSQYRWDSDIRTETPRDRDTYTTFFAWISRVGALPEFRARDTYDDPSLPVLVLNPAKAFDAPTVASVERYVLNGGQLLVLDDPVERPASTGPDLLAPFGIRYQPQTINERVYLEGGPLLPDLVWTLPLTLIMDGVRGQNRLLAERAGLGFTLLGTTPKLVDGHGLILQGRKAVGRGSVSVFIRSSVLSQMVMGDVWGSIEPGEPKEQLYALEYSLLSDLYPDLDIGHQEVPPSGD